MLITTMNNKALCIPFSRTTLIEPRFTVCRILHYCMYTHTHTHTHKTKSMLTYFQTVYKDQLIKVKPANSEFCAVHLKKPAISSRYYTVVPAGPFQIPAHRNKCVLK